jgi:hypothetical protein
MSIFLFVSPFLFPRRLEQAEILPVHLAMARASIEIKRAERLK